MYICWSNLNKNDHIKEKTFKSQCFKYDVTQWSHLDVTYGQKCYSHNKIKMWLLILSQTDSEVSVIYWFKCEIAVFILCVAIIGLIVSDGDLQQIIVYFTQRQITYWSRYFRNFAMFCAKAGGRHLISFHLILTIKYFWIITEKYTTYNMWVGSD